MKTTTLESVSAFTNSVAVKKNLSKLNDLNTLYNGHIPSSRSLYIIVPELSDKVNETLWSTQIRAKYPNVTVILKTMEQVLSLQ